MNRRIQLILLTSLCMGFMAYVMIDRLLIPEKFELPQFNNSVAILESATDYAKRLKLIQLNKDNDSYVLLQDGLGNVRSVFTEPDTEEYKNATIMDKKNIRFAAYEEARIELINLQDSLEVRDPVVSTYEVGDIQAAFEELEKVRYAASKRVWGNLIGVFTGSIVDNLFIHHYYPSAKTPNTNLIDELLDAGDMSAVLNIAAERLNNNPDDLPALFIIMGYAREQNDGILYAHCTGKIITIGFDTNTENFSKIFPDFLFSVSGNARQELDEGLSFNSYPDERRVLYVRESYPCLYRNFLVACELDGLFD